MAKEIVIGGQSGLSARNAINNNFNELYQEKHPRAHQITSVTDHTAVDAGDRNKYLKSDPTTGVPIWASILEADIPSSIARTEVLDMHASDEDNPHHTSLIQVADAGAGIEFGEPNPLNREIKVKLPNPNLNLLGFDAQGNLMVNFTNVMDWPQSGPHDDGDIMVSWNPDAQGFMGFDVATFREYILQTAGNPYKYENLCATSGKVVTGRVTKEGMVTAVWSLGNTLTVTIPDGIELIDLTIELLGYSNMTLIIDTQPSGRLGGWTPLTQAWRNDTGAQLVGLTLTKDLALTNKYVIAGLINTTTNHIRIHV